MNYEIRRLRPEELEAALDLAWTTYLRYEAPDYGPEGVASFRRDIVENKTFQDACRSGENRMWGALDGDRLVGIFVMRGKSHICLVFTHSDYHRKGIATALLKQLVADVKAEQPELKQLTLNSSPYGKPFYLKSGFRETEEEKTVDGIRFTPMILEIN